MDEREPAEERAHVPERGAGGLGEAQRAAGVALVADRNEREGDATDEEDVRLLGEIHDGGSVRIRSTFDSSPSQSRDASRTIA